MLDRFLPAFLASLALVPATSAQGWLDAPLRPEEAQGGEFRASGDFEGDGDVDVLWYEGAGIDWTGFRVFLNDGAGGFTPGPLSPFAGSDRRAVYGELRDVTGDGFADVLVNVAEPGSFRVEVYPGAAGAAFGAPFSFVTPGLVGFADDYAWGDFDGDGVAEIATRADLSLDNDTEIRWWDFTGGAFLPSPALTLPAPGVVEIAALDVDGDGLADLVAGDLVGDTLHLVVTDAGAPTAGGDVVLPLPSATCRVYPLVGDLDGDGDLDLVASCVCSGQWLVPVVQEPVGTFQALQAQELEGWSWSDRGRPGAVADWDGDGDLDVLSHNGNMSVASQRGLLSVLENPGDHVFALAAELTTDLEAPREAVGPADLDGDGRPDFVALRSLVFGSGRFEDVLPRFAFSAAPPPDDPAVALDLEGDGDLDVYRKSTGASSTDDLLNRAVFVNDGSARLTLRRLLPEPPADRAWGGAEAIADLTGDGLPDLLARLTTEGGVFTPPAFVAMHLLADDGLGDLVDAGEAVPGGAEVLGDSKGLLLTTDLDRDGDLDLLDLHPAAAGEPGGVWINDGTGLFGGFQSLFAGEPLAADDVDADGDVDVVTREGPSLLVLERNGAGGFADELLYGTNFDGRSPLLSDLDADGDPDLVLARTSFPTGLVVLENAGGAFGPAGPVVPVSVTAREWIGAATVDGDAIPDLVVGRGPQLGGLGGGSADHLQVVRGLGGLAYEAPRTYVGTRISGMADLDGDGDLDLFGETVIENRRFDGPADGSLRQSGPGRPGAGGVRPVLGASGPLRPGSTTAELRLRRGLGGSRAWLAVATSTHLTASGRRAAFVLPVLLGGDPGAPGQGTFALDLASLLARYAGETWTLQMTVEDPAASSSGSSTTNRLELVFGQ